MLSTDSLVAILIKYAVSTGMSLNGILLWPSSRLFDFQDWSPGKSHRHTARRAAHSEPPYSIYNIVSFVFVSLMQSQVGVRPSISLR